MRRKLFTAMSLLSLLLCVATVVLWVRSYSASDQYQRVKRAKGTALKGSVWVAYTFRGGVAWHLTRADESQLPDWRKLGRNAKDEDVLEAKMDRFKFDALWTDMFGDSGMTPSEGWSSRSAVAPKAGEEGSGWGFRWRTYGGGTTWFERREMSVPFWALVVGLGVLPCVWWMRGARMKPRPGACRNCGYSVTGNTSGICPECGTAVGMQQKSDLVAEERRS
jgi:hypothetical protein